MRKEIHVLVSNFSKFAFRNFLMPYLRIHQQQNKLEKVDEFQYLGVSIWADGDIQGEIKSAPIF